jgi:hypothetical protein
MRKIFLTRGKVALVDDEDFEWLSQWKWSVETHAKTFYALRSIYLGRENSKAKMTLVRMHRVIMGMPVNKEVDHKDGDGLNNQRDNLRVCTHSQNLSNRGKDKDNTSGYKGVWFDKNRGKWSADLHFKGRTVHLGRFTSVIEAAKAYDKAALKYFGEFARLNFPISS